VIATVVAAVLSFAVPAAADTCDGGLGPSPPLTIEPAAGQFPGGTITISGTGWDGVTDDAIGFYLGGRPLAVASIESNGSFELVATVPADLEPGVYNLRYEYVWNWVQFRTCRTPYSVIIPLIFEMTVPTLTVMTIVPSWATLLTVPDIIAPDPGPIVPDPSEESDTTEAADTTAGADTTAVVDTTAAPLTTAAADPTDEVSTSSIGDLPREESSTTTIPEDSTTTSVVVAAPDVGAGGSGGLFLGLVIGLGAALALGTAWTVGRRSGEVDFHGLPPGYGDPPPPGGW
jgi:hypothetical protein